jgi:TonB-linked SusC/RagA family outer membrane protein
MKRKLQVHLWMCALLFFSHSVLAQTRIITGVVSNSKNEPLIGVTVVVKGTTSGAYTDAEGKFSLAVAPDATTLVFKYIGMKTKEVTLDASNNIMVTLNEDALGLDEIVITANAISREKRGLGYATTQVKGDELTQGRNTNMIGALQGKVAGVNITSLTGGAGSSNRIVIRGGTSLTRNNQALIVVDGVPIDNSNFRNLTSSGDQADDLQNQVDYGNRGNDINPDDIESISVLKGPAAAALYGSRASNGAIIITTKTGKRGAGGKSKSSISFNSNITFSNVLKLPEFQNSYGQGDLDFTVDDRRENFSWGLPFDDKLRPWGQAIPTNDADTAFTQRIKPYSALPDNMRDFYSTGVAFRNNISMSGGSNNNSYYLSIGSYNSKGVIESNKYDKYTILFNGSSKISPKFSTSVSINYSNISSNLPSGGQLDASVYNNLLQTPRDIPITEGKDLTNPFNAYNDATGEYGFYGAYAVNPYFTIENFKNFNNVDRVYGNYTLTYDPVKWLNIVNRFGGDIYSDRRTQKWKKYDYSPIDPFYTGNNQTYQGKYSEDNYNQTSLTNDLMITAKHDFTKDIKGTILLGQNIRQSVLTNIYAQTNAEAGLALPGFYSLSNSNGPAVARNSFTKVRNVGYYTNINLSYKNFLFLDLTGRQDKTSTLPTDNNTYFYPSVSTSFVFSELFPEKLKTSAWTYGKLRISYAKVGNDAPAYVTTNSFSVTDISGGFGNTQFPFGSVAGYTQGDQLANSKIKPEYTSAVEVGAELGFWNDRLSVDFSYYQNSSKDQIISLPLASSTGFTSQIINTGEVRNNGIELGIRVVPINTQSGFKWELYGTYTKNTNKVESLYQGVNQINLGGFSGLTVAAQVGQPYGAFYGIDLDKDPNGNVIVDSATGLPQTTSDLVYLGNYQPDYIASLGSNFSFKGFTLGILFDTKQGGVFYSRTKDIMDFVGTAKETEDRADKVWEGSVYLNSEGQYVQNTTPYHPYNYFTSVIPAGQHIVDASYVKLRELSIGYKVPAKYLKDTPFGGASISIFGNNLFVWTAKDNLYTDPEQNSSGASNVQGFEFSSNPSVRNYGIDIKVSF